MSSIDLADNKECCDLKEAVNANYRQLKGYLISKTKDRDLGEELVQEIMLKANTAHRKGVAVENIRAWFFQIDKTTLADHYRKLASQQLLKETLAVPDPFYDRGERELGIMINTYLKPIILLYNRKYYIEKKKRKHCFTV